MGDTALVQARVDRTLKQDAETLFADLGLDVSTAIKLFLTQCVRLEGLPFDVSRRKVTSELSPKERLERFLADKPTVRLETDGNGMAIVDKEKHPNLYDWAVNG